MSGKVLFVGAGPGDPGLLTVKAQRAIERADVIVYAGSLINPEVLTYAKSGARRVDSASLSLDDIIEELAQAAQSGAVAVRLHSGDPSVYGAIAEQIALLDRRNIPYEVIPGVSSAFAAAAALGMEYTLPGITQTLIITRRSGRTPVPREENLSLLASHRCSMAIYLSIGMISDTVDDLRRAGLPDSTPAAVVYRASWPDEKRITGTLATIADSVAREDISRQAVIIVGEAVRRAVKEPSKLYSIDFGHGFRAVRGSKKEGAAVIAVTRRGWHTGKKILDTLDDASLYIPDKFREEISGDKIFHYSDLSQAAARLFFACDKLILVMATGIAVRIIAPLVRSKWDDPAVVAMDDSGRNIISLLSGHWGGANDLAEQLAHALDGYAVVTTESDVMGFPSVDLLVKAIAGRVAPEQTALIKNIQTDILEGHDVGFYPEELLGFSHMKRHPNIHCFSGQNELLAAGCRSGVIVTHAPVQHDPGKYLCVRPCNLVAGVGCHRDISEREIAAGFEEVFRSRNLSDDSLAMICTIENKQDETGLIEYARMRNVPLVFYSSNHINKVSVLSPESKHAMKTMGVHGVAEPCALIGADGGELIMPKIKLQNMTIAVAAAPLQRLFEDSEDITDV